MELHPQTSRFVPRPYLSIFAQSPDLPPSLLRRRTRAPQHTLPPSATAGAHPPQAPPFRAVSDSLLNHACARPPTFEPADNITMTADRACGLTRLHPATSSLALIFHAEVDSRVDSARHGAS